MKLSEIRKAWKLYPVANCPLYLLCFAVGNKGGKDIALRIANHLLKEVR